MLDLRRLIQLPIRYGAFLSCALFGILLSVTSPAPALTFQSAHDFSNLRDAKKTPQEKYMTSEEAFDLLSENPEILFVDVRDPAEIKMAGHPSLVDAIVPVRARSTEFDDELLEWALKDNPDFLMYMELALAEFGKSKDDTIIITCGSGVRSALAAQLLNEAGYSDVWHIPDGYVGDDKRGLNIANAWQLKGLPWSYAPVHGSLRFRILE